MSSRSTKELALKSFGVESSGQSIAFPETLTLPGYIHRKAISAVNDTADGSERSVNFDFLDNRWISNGTYTGTGIFVNAYGEVGANTGKIDALRSTVLPPFVHLHTHPSLGRETASESISIRASLGKWDEGKQVVESQKMLDYWVTTQPTPSAVDIRCYLNHASGRLINIISSDEGQFICVKKSLSMLGLCMLRRTLGIQKDLFKQRRLNGDIACAAFSRRTLYEAYDGGDYPSREEILYLASKLLSTDYVSYFSEDLENPALQRIDK
jgi:hypothetical protein